MGGAGYQLKDVCAASGDSDGRAGSQRQAKNGADLVELLAYSGCRVHEAVSIRWADVDFAKSSVRVTGGERGTKNHEARTVPMTDALRALLTRLKAAGDTKPGDFVSQIDSAKKCLRTTCKKLEYPQFKIGRASCRERV